MTNHKTSILNTYGASRIEHNSIPAIDNCEMFGIKTGTNPGNPTMRTYFHYNLQCECHSPNHFELVQHCKLCEPTEPEIIQFEPVEPKNR